MGGFNPQPQKTVDGRIRELEKMSKEHRRDKVKLDKTIRLFKAELKKLKKRSA